jgi:hypothetical protein
VAGEPSCGDVDDRHGAAFRLGFARTEFFFRPGSAGAFLLLGSRFLAPDGGACQRRASP